MNIVELLMNEIEMCEYDCIAGSLERNMAWVQLKEIAKVLPLTHMETIPNFTTQMPEGFMGYRLVEPADKYMGYGIEDIL